MMFQTGWDQIILYLAGNTIIAISSFVQGKSLSMISTVRYTPLVQTDHYLRSCLFQGEASAHFHPMIRKWLITGYSGSSGHGKGTVAEWQMISGSLISKTLISNFHHWAIKR